MGRFLVSEGLSVRWCRLRMFKLVLLLLTLAGLQAAPLAHLKRLHKTSSTHRLPNGVRHGNEHSDTHKPIPDDFRQGTEPSRRFIVNLKTSLVQDYIGEMERRADFISQPQGNGFGEMMRRHRIVEEVPEDVPAQRNGGGWVRVEEPSAPRLPDGFRQGTEPIKSIPDGFRQGTEPIKSIPDGFRQGTEPIKSIPDGFRQETEPIRAIPEGFRQGTEPIKSIPNGFRQGTEPVRSIPEGFRQGTEPINSIPDGFRQGTEPIKSVPHGSTLKARPIKSLPVGFSQGTEPIRSIPEGFRQGTEPIRSIPEGFRQGTEPIRTIPEGFRQGAEPIRSIPEGFRQGTEPIKSIPHGSTLEARPIKSLPVGFRQGTEPDNSIPQGFRQGTEPSHHIPEEVKKGTKHIPIPGNVKRTIPEGFRQGTEPSNARVQTQKRTCKGEVISGKCYEFNPTALAFKDAQALCRALAPNAELASITNGDLHSRLVYLVTKGGENSPKMTWLGGKVKNQKASWIDGSEWTYSDWMPGHPNIHTDKPVCLEMFKIDQSWWTAADCDLKRASICSYPISA